METDRNFFLWRWEFRVTWEIPITFFDGNILAIGERRKVRGYQFNDSGWELLGEDLGESSSGDSNFVSLSSDGLLFAIGTTEIKSSAVTSNIKVYEYSQSNANRQWNVYTTGEVLKFNSQNRISSLSLSADGTTLGCVHGKVMKINQYEAPRENELEGNWVRTGIIVFESPDDVSSSSLALSGDGRRLVVGTVQGNSLDQIQVYTFMNNDWILREQVGKNERFGNSVATSYDGKHIAVGAPEATVGDIDIGGGIGSVWIYEFLVV